VGFIHRRIETPLLLRVEVVVMVRVLLLVTAMVGMRLVIAGFDKGRATLLCPIYREGMVPRERMRTCGAI
jgi:hypothetical protein